MQRYGLHTALFLVALWSITVLVGLAVLFGTPAVAQIVENRPGSLKTVPTPEPANLNQFLKTNSKGAIAPAARAAAIALGKALFWDQTVGSDGQACATCHYNAGADSRTRNQINPGMRAIPGQTSFIAAPPNTTPWAANHIYLVGATIMDSNGNLQAVSLLTVDPDPTQPPHSGTTAPAWAQVIGSTTIDNDVTWTCLGPASAGFAPAANFPAVDITLKASHFPLTKFVNQQDHASGIVSDTQSVVSSQGVFDNKFDSIGAASCPNPPCLTSAVYDFGSYDSSGFGGIFTTDTASPQLGQVRNVEPRNTPSVINAVFNFRNFFDGRARNEFNGVDPIGDLDPYARVLLNASGLLRKVSLSGTLRLEDSSLASQAVGPALSDMEMSFRGRSFPDLGKKMLAQAHGLPNQLVAPDDSVLGNNTLAAVKSNYPAPGITKSYTQLIQAAFQSRWYGSGLIVTVVPNATDADGSIKLTFAKATKSTPPPDKLPTGQYTQMQFNFSLFWGIAIQMYEATLRADDTPFDQAFDSGNPQNFSIPSGCSDDLSLPPDPNNPGKSNCIWGNKQIQGMLTFGAGPTSGTPTGPGRCINCHGGPEFTNDSVRNVRLIDGKTEIMLMANNQFATYDVGFYNTAVRRCLPGPSACDDGGVGVTIGPLSLPVSFTRFRQMVDLHNPLDPTDPITIVCTNQPQACVCTDPTAIACHPGSRMAVDGAFKAPSIRNIELTAPYFHNGGELTLKDMIDFYDRGGNFPEYNLDNLDPDIGNFAKVPDPIIPGDLNDKVLELGLSDAEKDALVAFMKALTDERVRFQRAPFDHPQLFVPNLPPDPNCPFPLCQPGELPAVGRNGSSAPLPKFFDNLEKP
jgi:cytochrome c peroxidase